MRKINVNSLLKSEEGSILPYFVAWMFGVPGSLLFIIFALRGCH